MFLSEVFQFKLQKKKYKKKKKKNHKTTFLYTSPY